MQVSVQEEIGPLIEHAVVWVMNQIEYIVGASFAPSVLLFNQFEGPKY